MRIVKHGIELMLQPERAVLIPAYNVLCVADIHLGRSELFQKQGYPLSDEVEKDDIQRLAHLVESLTPDTIIFLGDTAHAKSVTRGDSVLSLCRAMKHANVKKIFLSGNHEGNSTVLGADNVQLLPEYQLDTLLFRHAPGAVPADVHLLLAGHVHPVAILRETTGAALRLDVFHYHADVLTLPAFSGFAGGHVVTEGERYGIVGERVMQIP